MSRMQDRSSQSLPKQEIIAVRLNGRIELYISLVYALLSTVVFTQYSTNVGFYCSKSSLGVKWHE
jgi:hypothetical protein